jgi:hypothetical protein
MDTIIDLLVIYLFSGLGTLIWIIVIGILRGTVKLQ